MFIVPSWRKLAEGIGEACCHLFCAVDRCQRIENLLLELLLLLLDLVDDLERRSYGAGQGVVDGFEAGENRRNVDPELRVCRPHGDQADEGQAQTVQYDPAPEGKLVDSIPESQFPPPRLFRSC